MSRQQFQILLLINSGSNRAAPHQLVFTSCICHLVHLAGSTDRLLTYARGEALPASQRAALAGERAMTAPYPPVGELMTSWRTTVEGALRQLATTPEATLTNARLVGRAQLPSTVLGLLFHAAEHAQRHVGQLVTTAKIIRGTGLDAAMS